MLNNQVESIIKEWFKRHGLPWSDKIAKKLSDYRVEYMEHLKLPEPEFIADLFKGEKPIVKTMVKLAWKHLGGQKDFEFKRAATQIPLGTVPAAATKSAKGNTMKNLESHAIHENGTSSVMKFKNFSHKITKTAKEKSEEREERKRRKLEQSMGIIDVTGDDGTCDTSNTNQPSAAASVPNPSIASSARAENTAPFLSLPASDYRVDRCFLSETLLDKAEDAEKICWSDNLIPTDSQYKDLEDPKGYYKVLGCSKTTSSKGIATAFQTMKIKYTYCARSHHPDKTSDKEKIARFHRSKDTYELQKAALQVLGTMKSVGNAYPDRVNYDREGEGLREKFRVEFCKIYPDSSFAIRAEAIADEESRQAIFDKGQATRQKFKDDEGGSLDEVARAWVRQGQQNNESRLCVHHATLIGSHSTSEIARYVRLIIYNTLKNPWDGVAHTDKKYKQIHATITRIKKGIKNGNMDAVINGGGRNGKGGSGLKSKSMKAGTRGRKVLDQKKKVINMNIA